MRWQIFRGLWLLAGLGLAATAPSPASGAAPQVIPFPGTPDAAPASQIILSARAPADLRSLTVTGSHSGRHAGHLIALPSGAGTAFVPARRFDPGEFVRVRAELGHSDRGEPSRLSYSFRIAISAPTPNRPTPLTAVASRSDRWQVYPSEPHLHPPVVHVGGGRRAGAGDVFLTPVHSQLGPMILNSAGQLVYFRHTGRLTAFNLELSRYRGKRVLTWWQGRVVAGHGSDGQNVILDSSYRPVAVLHAGYGYSSDLHEFQLVPHGRALIDAYVPVHADLSSVGGPSDGRVLDCVIQELDVKTGRVLWEWHALGHVPLSDSYGWVPGDSTPFDFFHLNSIQALPDGRLIISARNTWAVYMIDQRSGRVIWKLGGKDSSFRMGAGTNFEWQHDARLHNHGILTLFDDGAFPQEEGESSAKELRIDLGSGSVSLVHRYTHSPSLLAGAMGSAQLLSGGRMFVGWGSASAFSEYAASGHQVLGGNFRLGVSSYRAYRFPWIGHPLTRPGIAVAPASGGRMRVYASWNGATQVASWRIEAGGRRHQLTTVATRRVSGFETAMTVRDEPPYFQVLALDGKGHVLGHSYARRAPPRLAVFGPHAFVSTSDGLGTIPVACVTHHACTPGLTISSGRSVLFRGSFRIPGGQAALAYFALSSSGLRRVEQAPGRRLPVQVALRDGGGLRARGHLTLIPYSISGQGPQRTVSKSPSIQFVGGAEFVSSNGQGGILAACQAFTPCHVQTSISSQGKVIATSPAQVLGAREVGYLRFRLTPAGKSMLALAPGNQLAAQVVLRDRADTAVGQVALIGYR